MKALAGLAKPFLELRQSKHTSMRPRPRSYSGETRSRSSASLLILLPYVGFSGSGAETRGRSAIDVALWDLFGKVTEQPVFQLLGGLARNKIRTYNTCAGYRYVRSHPDWDTSDWGLESPSEGPYEDLDAFLKSRRRVGA